MEYVEGPTPCGGAYAYIYYLDNDGKESNKENGTNGYILEFDDKGNRMCETRFIIKGKFVAQSIISKISIDK